LFIGDGGVAKKFFTLTATIFLLGFAVFFVVESSPTTDSVPTTGNATVTEGNLIVADTSSPWGYDNFKVGYVKDTGFLYEDRPGHQMGYGYEYMEFLEHYAYCRFSYTEFNSWEDLLAAFENKTIDLMPGMPGDAKKIPNSLRTSHVIGRFPMELIVRDKIIKPHMKIGYMPSSNPTPALPDIARDEGFTYEEVSFPTFREMIEAYNNGTIDGYVDALLDTSKADNAVAFFDRQSYRLVIHKDNQPLFNRMDAAMDQMLLMQSSIRDRLTQKYLRQEGFPLTLSREERDYLAARRKLKAAIFIYYQPFAYHDENGQLVGFFPDLLKRVSEDLGVEIELIETNSIKETHDLVQSGGVDIVADAILDHSWGRSANVAVTQSYLTYEYAAVTRANYELDFSNHPAVAANSNMLYTKSFVEKNVPHDKIIYFDSWQECMRAVSDGRADVTYILKSSVAPLIEETGTYGLEISPMTYFTEPVCMGVYAYENEHLWHILNKEVNHMDNTWIQNVLNQHRQPNIHITPSYVIYKHPIKAIIFITLLSIGIGSFILYRNRMQQRHFELVQHMAYTDLRYDLPNVPYLEKEVPNLFVKLTKENPEVQTFFVIFAMDSGATIAEETGRKMIDKRFKEMAAELKDAEPVVIRAAGIDIEHLICFCKAENVEKILDWSESVIKNYSYIETADAQAKVILHTKAGITEYIPKMYVQQAIDRALSACHHQKNDGAKIFDEKMEESLTSRHMIESRMEQALRDGEFKAFYQPKYDIKTRRIIGAEALVRWISPETGFMPPGKFIPLFEQNGFVIQVDYYILEKTFQLQQERLKAGKEVIPISVNQSRLHMTEENYLEKMKAIVEKYNLPPGLIELEITETMFGDFDNKASQKNAENIVRGLHDLGFSLSVDDFGSGYSSFSLLGILPMEVMKIDRSVLVGTDTSDRMKEILSYIIELGHALKMEVLCEGIETRVQEELLMELGCNYGQGFLNAKPMPVEDFVNFFETRNAEVDAGTVVIPN